MLYFHSAIKVRYVQTPLAVVNLSLYALSPRQRRVVLIHTHWADAATAKASLLADSISTSRSRLVNDRGLIRSDRSGHANLSLVRVDVDRDTSFDTRDA